MSHLGSISYVNSSNSIQWTYFVALGFGAAAMLP
jgi:hypothetical protein